MYLRVAVVIVKIKTFLILQCSQETLFSDQLRKVFQKFVDYWCRVHYQECFRIKIHIYTLIILRQCTNKIKITCERIHLCTRNS